MAAMANAVGRRHLARFIERTVFHDPRERPPFLGTARFAGLGNGEIVPAPIPEPATTSLVATFALVALGYKQRRRFCPAPRTRQ
jgi:hypothetical protein